MTPNVFIVDDDAAVRASTETLLAVHDLVALSWPDAESFIAEPDTGEPACVLLDYRMPGLDGLAALPRIRAARPTAAIVMITAHGDVEVAVKAMKAGAVDLIEKPWTADDLVEAVQRALDESTRRLAVLRATSQARDKLAALTPREADVLRELITGAPNKIIAHRLGLSPRTVEFHRAKLMEKTGVHSVAELVTLVVDAGSGGESNARSTKIASGDS